MSSLNDFLKSFEENDEKNIEHDKNIVDNKTSKQYEEKPIQKNNKIKLKLKPKIKNINIDNNNSNINENKKNNDDVNKNSINDLEVLFKNSETPEEFKFKWMEIYEKAIHSDKKTLTNKKIKNGKFRINKLGELEILPDHNTYNKSSKDLLKESWQ